MSGVDVSLKKKNRAGSRWRQSIRQKTSVLVDQAWSLFRYIRIFFFQAEDGIRDWSVTGVQTCALPIYRERRESPADARARPGKPSDPKFAREGPLGGLVP